MAQAVMVMVMAMRLHAGSVRVSIQRVQRMRRIHAHSMGYQRVQSAVKVEAVIRTGIPTYAPLASIQRIYSNGGGYARRVCIMRRVIPSL